MPALPAITLNFVNSVIASLQLKEDAVTKTGSARDLYVRQAHIASALKLMQDALYLPAPLTATGGSTATVVDAGAFVANSQIGNVVQIVDAGGVAPEGEQRIVLSNTANTLTVSSPFTAAVEAGDTYTILGAFLDSSIQAMRTNEHGVPNANPYGSGPLVLNALVRMAAQLGAALPEALSSTNALTYSNPHAGGPLFAHALTLVRNAVQSFVLPA